VKQHSQAGERTQRVADFIRDEVARLLLRDMRDPRIDMVTVTEVRVSKDLAFADIYVSSLSTNDETSRGAMIDTLNGAAGWIRSELAKRHTMRTTPRPRFHYDELIESSAKLDRAIDRAIAADKERVSEADNESA
jgi:ribosome-binding factor A